MELRLLFCAALMIFLSCGGDSAQDQSKFGTLKATLAENPTKENRHALIAAYQEEIRNNPDKADDNARYLRELAKLRVADNNHILGLQTLMLAIEDYPNSAETAENVWQLGHIYHQNLQRPSVANIIKKLYAEEFPNGQFAEEAQRIGQSNPTSVADDLAKLGNSMYNETTHKVDYQAANDYIRVGELIAMLRPEDPQSPEYLHKIGETARAIRTFPKAIKIYEKIYTQYPNFEKAPQALFLRAFTYDNDLGDKGTARALYQEFLDKYPNDEFADDTRFLLDNLTKSDEEIIESFNQGKE